jgi:membrane protease YdiL (CAAX protease family)
MWKKNLKLFIFLYAIAIINAYIIAFFSEYLNVSASRTDTLGFTRLEWTVISVLMVPVIETLFLQVLLYYFFTKVCKLNNTVLCILFSSLIFALLHYYSWLYIIGALVGGIILNTFFVVVLKRCGAFYAFLLTMLFHSLYNLFTSISNYYI